MVNNTISRFDLRFFCSFLSFFDFIENGFECKRREAKSKALVELRHELDPVKTQRVQESRQSLHHDQDRQREDCPSRKHEDNENRSLNGVGLFQAQLKHHVPQNLRQLCEWKRWDKIILSFAP